MGQSYRDLIAWQKAMVLVAEIYKASEGFPKHELYGLTSQLRRAAVSIPSSIAEGQGRYFDREFTHFLSNALGSLMEVETQLMIAENLGYLGSDQTKPLLSASAEIGKILNGLSQKMRARAAAK